MKSLAHIIMTSCCRIQSPSPCRFRHVIFKASSAAHYARLDVTVSHMGLLVFPQQFGQETFFFVLRVIQV